MNTVKISMILMRQVFFLKKKKIYTAISIKTITQEPLNRNSSTSISSREMKKGIRIYKPEH